MTDQTTEQKKHRVVITGLGWITPLGHDIETVWGRVRRGESGVGPIEHFDAGAFPTKIAGQVREYDYKNYVSDVGLHGGVGLNTGFALGAAKQAWDCSGLGEFTGLNKERMGIYLGSGEGSPNFEGFSASNLGSWSDESREIDAVKWAELAMTHLDKMGEVEQEPNMPLSHLAMEFGAQGPCYNCLTACAASTQAIGEATQILMRGDADVMLTGGAHTMIHPLGVTGFNRLTALSTNNAEPTKASRPFSGDRDGFVLGEGSGMLVIETLEHAQSRGAKVLAEIVGFGSSADAYRITDIHPEGRGGIESMTQAINAAGLKPSDIDYISAHGTSTKENDSIETKAVKAVFGDDAKKTPMSSVKSMFGHLIAAAGAVEAITCVLAIRDGVVPPTMNLNTPDPDLDLDYVANAAREMAVDVCLSNSFGFGGQNDTLVIKRFTE